MGYYTINSTELYHHGILGQKWGVRRYQNADGSLTAAGRAHYGVEGVRQNGKIEKLKKTWKTAVASGSEQGKKTSEKIKSKKKQIEDSVKAKKAEKESNKEDAREETEEKEKRKLTTGQKVAIAVAATAVTAVALKVMYDKGAFDKAEDFINSNQTFSNMQRKAVIAAEAKSREKLVNEFSSKYGSNDSNYTEMLNRVSKGTDRAKLSETKWNEKKVHRNYDLDYVHSFDDKDYRAELRKGYDEVVREARPHSWVRNNLDRTDFKSITDSYFNEKAEEYLKELGLEIRK